MEPKRGGILPLVDGSGGHGDAGVGVAGEWGGWAGGLDPREDLVEHGGLAEVDQFEVERFGHPGEVGVPLQGFAELEAGVEFAPAK